MYISKETEKKFAKCRKCRKPTSIFLPDISECKDCSLGNLLPKKNAVAWFNEHTGNLEVKCPVCQIIYLFDESNIKSVMTTGKCVDCNYDAF